MRGVIQEVRRGLTIDEWQNRHLTLVTDEGEALPFLDNDAQAILARELVESEERALERHMQPRDLVIKPRRAGFTAKLLGRQVVRGVTEQRRKFLYMNATEKDTVETFQDARRMWEHLPRWAKPKLRNPSNRSEMSFVETGCEMKTKSASVAGGTRGRGYAEVLWDEAPRCAENLSPTEQQRFLAAIMPAIRYGPMRLLFTPDGVNDIAHDLWQASKKGDNDWNRILITHWQCSTCRYPHITDDQRTEIRDTITEEESYLLQANGIEDLAEQLERLAWRRAMKRELGNLFPQENPEDDVSCWISPGTMFFDADAITYQQRIAKPIIQKGAELAGPNNECAPKHGNMVRYYVPPVPGREYIVATDFGIGHGTGDPSMTAVLDYETGEIVAVAHSRDVDVPSFARISIDLCRQYNDAMWAPELNNPGRAGVRHALDVLEWPRIYRHMTDGAASVTAAHELGFPTHQGTRSVMLEDLDLALRQHHEARGGVIVLNDERIIAEHLSFKLRDRMATSGTTKRYEAERGTNDEGPIVCAIANYVRNRGGINPSIKGL